MEHFANTRMSVVSHYSAQVCLLILDRFIHLLSEHLFIQLLNEHLPLTLLDTRCIYTSEQDKVHALRKLMSGRVVKQ